MLIPGLYSLLLCCCAYVVVRVRSADGTPLALLVPDMLMSILEFGFQSTCYDGRD